MLKFLLVANADQRLRYAYYFDHVPKEERQELSNALIAKCSSRSQSSCSFINHKEFNVVYRKIGPLLFIVGTDGKENNLAVYEFIRAFVDVLDTYFTGMTERHIIANHHKVHFILQQMVSNGSIVETNIKNVLAPIRAYDSA
uniref:AP complex subunit sigma n=1 Tax=Ornithodoros turicata TaxID=34597 RepID=A0A2R5LEZ9_9ACAR